MDQQVPKGVAATILLTAYRAGKLTMSDLCERTRFSTITVLNHVNSLLAAGLLEEEREGTFPRRRLIKPSQEGARMAALLNLAELTKYGGGDLIEMGAKAGRIAAYQEGLTSLRRGVATKEWLAAELLLNGIGTLASSLAQVEKGLPEALGKEREAFREWSKRLEAYFLEGQRRLNAKDLHGCIALVSKAASEFSGAAQVFIEAARKLKEMRLEELANFIEFVTPKQTQKE